MSAASLARTGLMIAEAIAPAPSVDIVQTVREFCGMDARKAERLAHACRQVADACVCDAFTVRTLKPRDFETLKAFAAFADGDFALAIVARPDGAVDQPYSPDESHFKDQERL